MYQNTLHEQEQLKNRIWDLRHDGHILEAISVCLEATEKHKGTYSFPKMLGDLYASQGEYPSAAKAYRSYLKRIKPLRGLFSEFAKRHYRLKKSCDAATLRTFELELMAEAQKGAFDPLISKWVGSLVEDDITTDMELSPEGKELVTIIQEDGPFGVFLKKIKVVERINATEACQICDKHILNRKRAVSTIRIDSHCISVYERLRKYDSALKIAFELLHIRFDSTVVRSVFRLCRKIGDYAAANRIIDRYPQILEVSNDFNILYELVYYHEFYDNLDELLTTLRLTERAGLKSIPIQKTVKNFYIRFGMPDEALRVDDTIAELLSGKEESYPKFSEEVKETEAGVGSKITELYSKVAQRERIAAISDLTTGISHELGQPITNIRYTVQYYSRVLRRNFSQDKVFDVFEDILEETERMGDLVKRLSPLTSSRNVTEKYDLMDRIARRLHLMDNRLVKSRTIVEVFPKRPVCVVGDPIHFDQIVSNLLVNSIYSIEKGQKNLNKISIRVIEKTDHVDITFTDTGIGINAKSRGKIFNPFYTTKSPGEGEGLGLFIIWNLLKMHGGKIQLSTRYHEGAQFVLTLPKISEHQQEIEK